MSLESLIIDYGLKAHDHSLSFISVREISSHLCTEILGTYPSPLTVDPSAGILVRGCWVVMHSIVDQLLALSTVIGLTETWPTNLRVTKSFANSTECCSMVLLQGRR